jgi:hypothetical protein
VTNSFTLPLDVCDLKGRLSLEAFAALSEGRTRKKNSDEKFIGYVKCVSLCWLSELTF